MWNEFFTFPGWYRILLGAVLLVYTVRMPMRPPCFTGVCCIPVILILRDLMSYWLPGGSLVLLSEFAVMGMYVCMFDAYRDKKRGRIFILCLAPIMGLLTLYAYASDMWLQMYILQVLVLAAAAVVMFVRMNAISPKNVRHGLLLEQTKDIFTAFYITVLVLETLLPSRSFFYQGLLLPSTFLLHALVIRHYYHEYRAQFEKRLQFAHSYINSVFDFIRKVNEALSEHSAVKQVMDFVIESVIENTHADSGVIFLYNEKEKSLKVSSLQGFYPPPYPIPEIVKQKVGKVEVYFRSKPIPLGETFIGKCAENRTPLYIHNSAKNQLTGELVEDAFNYSSSLIVLPLVSSDRLMGVLSIALREKEHHFTQEDFERSKVFADYTASTIEALYNYMELLEKREMERDIEIAGGIQRNLFPKELPQSTSISISAQTIPARGVSGDYYDFIQLPDDQRIGCLVCDVAGKGIPASLVMVMIRTIVHLIASKQLEARDFVSFINRGVAGNVGIERFATLSFLLIDPGSGKAQYCNAAHHPLLVFRKERGEFEQIDSEGVPVGIDAEWEYPQTHFSLKEGDLMVLYTDGITEAMNTEDEQFGFDRLKAAIQASADLSPDEVKQNIFAAIDRFVGQADQHDDETLVVLRKSLTRAGV